MPSEIVICRYVNGYLEQSDVATDHGRDARLTEVRFFDAHDGKPAPADVVLKKMKIVDVEAGPGMQDCRLAR